MQRSIQLNKLQKESDFDVLIIGAGVNGACIYHHLCQSGYRVLLVDKADFAAGTSQSSGVMIWGGLLYLRNLDFRSVCELSADRDKIAQSKNTWMTPQMMRYLPSTSFGRSKQWMQMGLWLYWLLGRGRRQAPREEKHFPESVLIKPNFVKTSLAYEEIFLEQSDARFVYRWLAPCQQAGQMALNYCHIQTGQYHHGQKKWQFDLKDQFSDQTYSIQTRLVINCAGAWTDQINADFDISSPYRHVLSKGVYLGLPRAVEHQSSLFFDLGEHNDVISLVPWGPIALWGPTETAVHDIDTGMRVSKEDIDFLLAHYNQRFSKAMSRADIISLRCGVRPLAVDKNYKKNSYPLDLSRQQKVILDKEKSWISCYGGKITGCTRMADKVLNIVQNRLDCSPASNGAMYDQWEKNIVYKKFSDLNYLVPAIESCIEYEQCYTLEDYLRRRTNLSQWLPRMGLGHNNVYIDELKNFSLQLAHGDPFLAEKLLADYQKKVVDEFDSLLN